MKFKIILLLSIIGLLLIANSILIGCDKPLIELTQKRDADIAIVFDTGGIVDDDFNKGCLKGAEKAQNEMGVKLDYVVANSDDDYYKMLKRYASIRQYKLIIGVGANMADSLSYVAKEYPNQKFAVIDTFINTPNMVSVQFRDEQSSFLAGAVSAMVSKKEVLGFIGGMDIQVIHRFLAGYRAGAEYINPNMAVRVLYVNSWSNPDLARRQALSLYDQNIDIIFGAAGTSSDGVINAAILRNTYAIGVDTDKKSVAPDNILASTLKKVDSAVYDVINDITGGAFEPGIVYYGLKESGVSLSLNDGLPLVTPEIKTKITEITNKIISGSIKIPEE